MYQILIFGIYVVKTSPMDKLAPKLIRRAQIQLHGRDHRPDL